MRSLTVMEVEQVSGGGARDFIQGNMTMGGGIGSAIGFVVTNTVHGATRGGLVGASGMLAFSLGYLAGTAIYESFRDRKIHNN